MSKTECLKQQIYFLSVVDAGKSKIKVQAGSVSGETLLLTVPGCLLVGSSHGGGDQLMQ
jgi:hypothetical protein